MTASTFNSIGEEQQYAFIKPALEHIMPGVKEILITFPLLCVRAFFSESNKFIIGYAMDMTVQDTKSILSTEKEYDVLILKKYRVANLPRPKAN